MPIYDFECPRCANRIDKIQGMNDPNPNCEVCNAVMVKMPTLPLMIRVLHKGGTPVRTKGYKEDYAREYRRRANPQAQ